MYCSHFARLVTHKTRLAFAKLRFVEEDAAARFWEATACVADKVISGARFVDISMITGILPGVQPSKTQNSLQKIISVETSMLLKSQTE